MPARWDEVSALGHELSKCIDSEVALRAAVGRIYYGAFWLVRERLVIRPERKNAHEQAAAALAKNTRKNTGEQYRELMELRNLADYEPQESEWQQKVLRATRLFEHIRVEMHKRQLLSERQ